MKMATVLYSFGPNVRLKRPPLPSPPLLPPCVLCPLCNKGYNPWDTGTDRYAPVNASWVPTSRNVSRTDIEVEIVAALKYTNADGIDARQLRHHF